jgi:hypothetical protein
LPLCASTVEIGSPANIDANAAPAMINPNLRRANAAAESVRADTAPIISVRNIGNPPVLARRKWFAAARPRTVSAKLIAPAKKALPVLEDDRVLPTACH